MNFAKRLDSVEEYYFSKKLKEVRKLQMEGKPIINMGIGSPDMPPPKAAIEALTEAALHGDHKYQSYQGLPELRKAFADFYETHYRVKLNPESEILPLMGSKEGIMHASLAFLNPGDEALIPAPGYPTYTSATKLIGAVPRYYKLSEANGWLPDLDLLERRDLSGVRLMWLNYPHMPTGAKIDKKGFQTLVDFALRHRILLINDNPYSFLLNDHPLSILEADNAKDIAMELNSLSKTFNMSGWRVGAVFGRADYVNAILKVKSNMDSGMYYGLQKGAIAALKSSKAWFSEMNDTYRRRRKLIFKIADQMGCRYEEDTCGLFVWCKLPDDSPDGVEMVDRWLYDKHIFIAPGSIFGEEYNRYVRFSLCVEEDKIEEALKRLL